MDKQEIRNILQEARASHDFFVNDGQVLLDGINLDRLEQPVPLEECHLTHWCNSNQSFDSDFPWFKELTVSHANLHDKFNVLFHESMRKYNPKTFDQLLERFNDLKTDAEIFNSKLNEIESEIDNMPEDAFTTSEKEDSNESMHSIDIIEFDEAIDNPSKNESNSNENMSYQNFQENLDIDHTDVTKNIERSDNNKKAEFEEKSTIKQFDESSRLDTRNNNQEYSVFDNPIDNSETIKLHISLKEQNIAQLQQQKELSQLELAHLEETHKLTLQGANQLEKSYGLKQQEIELDQKDNNQLVSFKSNIRQETKDKLSDITKNKETIRQEIEDLEQQITDDQIKQESDKSSATIAKQFEELKQNKHKDLERLETHLQTRKIDLKQLKDQVLLLEEEIAEMESDISKKNQDMSSLKEKEQIKNEEFAAQLAQYERIKDQRNSSIKEKQIDLDALLSEDQDKKRKLETIDSQLTELTKKTELLEQSNSEILSDLEQQKQTNREKVEEIVRLKVSKEAEISSFEKSIKQAKEALEAMKSSPQSNDQEPAMM